MDIRTNIDFAGASGVLIGASTKDDSKIQLFSLATDTGELLDIPGAPIITKAEDETYGFCFFKSPMSGEMYAITTDKSGLIEQWALTARAGGGVDSRRVRQLRVDTQPEGCVADDANSALFVGEEDVGIWRFNAEPSDVDAKTLIARTGVGDIEGARLSADVEGLAIYAPKPNAPQTGYLIASSQGDHTYALFDRASPHSWHGTFQISFNGALVGDTDGLAVTASPVGPSYPSGMLVVQDGVYKKPGRAERNQNFKYVSWAKISAALEIDQPSTGTQSTD
ncbi:MAG: phytase [Pseudomonadota bacterium]